ncbi:hypothetical protein PCE1_004260 [Barthelona sp. PCE]
MSTVEPFKLHRLLECSEDEIVSFAVYSNTITRIIAVFTLNHELHFLIYDNKLHKVLRSMIWYKSSLKCVVDMQFNQFGNLLMLVTSDASVYLLKIDPFIKNVFGSESVSKELQFLGLFSGIDYDIANVFTNDDDLFKVSVITHFSNPNTNEISHTQFIQNSKCGVNMGFFLCNNEELCFFDLTDPSNFRTLRLPSGYTLENLVIYNDIPYVFLVVKRKSIFSLLKLLMYNSDSSIVHGDRRYNFTIMNDGFEKEDGYLAYNFDTWCGKPVVLNYQGNHLMQILAIMHDNSSGIISFLPLISIHVPANQKNANFILLKNFFIIVMGHAPSLYIRNNQREQKIRRLKSNVKKIHIPLAVFANSRLNSKNFRIKALQTLDIRAMSVEVKTMHGTNNGVFESDIIVRGGKCLYLLKADKNYGLTFYNNVQALTTVDRFEVHLGNEIERLLSFKIHYTEYLLRVFEERMSFYGLDNVCISILARIKMADKKTRVRILHAVLKKFATSLVSHKLSSDAYLHVIKYLAASRSDAVPLLRAVLLRENIPFLFDYESLLSPTRILESESIPKSVLHSLVYEHNRLPAPLNFHVNEKLLSVLLHNQEDFFVLLNLVPLRKLLSTVISKQFADSKFHIFVKSFFFVLGSLSVELLQRLKTFLNPRGEYFMRLITRNRTFSILKSRPASPSLIDEPGWQDMNLTPELASDLFMLSTIELIKKKKPDYEQELKLATEFSTIIKDNSTLWHVDRVYRYCIDANLYIVGAMVLFCVGELHSAYECLLASPLKNEHTRFFEILLNEFSTSTDFKLISIILIDFQSKFGVFPLLVNYIVRNLSRLSKYLIPLLRKNNLLKDYDPAMKYKLIRSYIKDQNRKSGLYFNNALEKIKFTLSQKRIPKHFEVRRTKTNERDFYSFTCEHQIDKHEYLVAVSGITNDLVVNNFMNDAFIGSACPHCVMDRVSRSK